ncbi:MAG: helix-hairpin-helix domain-containing protein [Chloroflexi bacterium]|nr:helix-hairpin-helix domain-containing protein [Chloroflexota bacterium]
MEVEDKLHILTAAARYDVCGYNGTSRTNDSPLRFLHRVAVPGKGTVCLFKVLMTNVCTNDCAYCVNQVGRDVRRSTFRPEELARLFMQTHDKRLAQGLFLSSAIGGGNPSRMMESMIDTVAILRQRYEFKGYVHLKILPGASLDCVEEACKLADRVSVNMEAPTAKHLAKLSLKKHLHQDIVERMRWVKKLRDADESLAPSGQTTQFVVGAASETDRELLNTVTALYREVELRRAYFSPFVPVMNSRSEGLHAAPPIRGHRLYQADWLLRVYGFPLQEVELALNEKGNLPLTKDPKMLIARSQPWLFPVAINKASYDELLRVPGIGPISANRIVEARKDHSIDSLEQLKKMRVVTKRAASFIWLPGMPVLGKQASFMPQLEEDMAQEELSLAGVVE